MLYLISARRSAALIGVGFVITAAAGAGTAEAAIVRGTVVHRNARARSFIVANRAGDLYAIHAARRPRPGSAVTVSVRKLANGTYAARWIRMRAYHRHAHVRLRGVVSYVDLRHGTFTLSARGVSMLVRVGRAHTARAADALPPVGASVTATGSVDDQGDLSEQAIQDNGTDTTFDLEGTVLAVNTAAQTITVSSDDDQQGQGSIVVSVPSTFDISMFSLGQEVELTVTLQPDGSYVLAGSSSDEGVQGADDQGEQQGDQTDSNDQGDDSNGQGSGSGSGSSGSGGTSTDSSGSGGTSTDSSSSGGTSTDSSGSGGSGSGGSSGSPVGSTGD